MPHNHEKHVCPFWVGYILASPLRKLFYNPKKLLSPYISEGMTVLDIGSAMGFFSLPMAEMTGATGKVVCVDIQEKMLLKLRERAVKAGVEPRIETRLAGPDTLGIADLKGKLDFALASAVVHEVPSPIALFDEVIGALKPGAKLIVGEPKGHVDEAAFEETVSLAESVGFSVVKRMDVFRSWTVVLEK